MVKPKRRHKNFQCEKPISKSAPGTKINVQNGVDFAYISMPDLQRLKTESRLSTLGMIRLAGQTRNPKRVRRGGCSTKTRTH